MLRKKNPILVSLCLSFTLSAGGCANNYSHVNEPNGDVNGYTFAHMIVTAARAGDQTQVDFLIAAYLRKVQQSDKEAQRFRSAVGLTLREISAKNPGNLTISAHFSDGNSFENYISQLTHFDGGCITYATAEGAAGTGAALTCP